MIDLHCHVLPEVDDGSKSTQMSLEMLNRQISFGFDKVMCTPHQNRDEHRTDKLKAAFEKLQNDAKNLPVKLYLGAEIYYYPEMIKHLKEGELLTLNGTKFVLVEFSTRQQTDIADVVYELSIAGFKPIVAHVERYYYLQKNDFYNIKESGGYLQINASSIANKAYCKTVKKLLKYNLVDFIASDCHDDVKRTADFKDIFAYVKKKYPDRFESYFGFDKFLV
jgi:protein-tyrosine phosphatase